MMPYVRNRIVDFEDKKNFDLTIENISRAFSDDELWQKLESKILNGIKVLTFPKSISEGTSENKDIPLVISNILSDKAIIEKYNNFIDICIEGQIIGSLWVMTIGKDIDSQLIEECYGNRLTDNLISEYGSITQSPNLFKPYYQQYESWRDRALSKAEEYITNKSESVMITMLDLSRYFYNIDLSNNKYFKMTTPFTHNNEDLVKLNNLLYKIFEKYSSFFNCSHVMLPIGYLPSKIISNFYLHELDQKIKTMDSILYYGRYVDDMLIVTRIENENNLKSELNERGIKYISEYMIKELVKYHVLDEMEDKGLYNIKGYSLLQIQKSKLRFFYLNSNGSDELLKQIRKDIAQNCSEFNFIPEIALDDNEILKIERDDTPNKIRAVKKAEIDKYSLSKLLGRKLLISKFDEEQSVELFIKELGKLLNHKEILSNYTLWENILNYFVINDRLDDIVAFSSKVVTALNEMDEMKNHLNEYEYLNNENIKTVKYSLIYFYFACVCRSLALVWGPNVKSIVHRISEILRLIDIKGDVYSEIKINKYRKNYCISRMVNRSFLPLSMTACMTAIKPSDEKENQRMYSLQQYINSKHRCTPNKRYKKYMPYIETPFDIMFTNLMMQIKNNELSFDERIIENMFSRYSENFDTHGLNSLNSLISMTKYSNGKGHMHVKISTSKKMDVVKIAVANVKMDKEEVIAAISNQEIDKTERCQQIIEIVNESIRGNVDILVMPECYVPLEFLSILQKKAANHDMTIVCGVQHVRYKENVYNLTAILIPIVTDDFRYTIPFFHQKVFFSPEEKGEIEKKQLNCIEGRTYAIYEWKGIRFVPYCCYELTSIDDRSIFKKDADIIIGVEWNKDIAYFGNIMESLSRDLYCYCVQSNMSEYGDSRIIRPTKSVYSDILKVKGGENAIVLIGEVNIRHLHEARDRYDKNDIFKRLPAGYNEYR